MAAPWRVEARHINRLPRSDRNRQARVPDRRRQDRGAARQYGALIMPAALNLVPLGYAAGALTILSPCVLPLVPIVLGSAAGNNRWGPLALASGLVVSFTSIALVVALAGASSGVDAEVARVAGAV